MDAQGDEAKADCSTRKIDRDHLPDGRRGEGYRHADIRWRRRGTCESHDQIQERPIPMETERGLPKSVLLYRACRDNVPTVCLFQCLVTSDGLLIVLVLGCWPS